MRKLAPCILATALTCLAPYSLLAANVMPELPVDSRMKVLMYNEGDIYTITVKYGFQTHLVFGQGEEIEMISVGDRSMWQIVPMGNRMFIRAMVEDVTTNMTVITSQRSYQFDLKSIGEKGEGNIYVAKFIYPEDMPRGNASLDEMLREVSAMPSPPATAPETPPAAAAEPIPAPPLPPAESEVVPAPVAVTSESVPPAELPPPPAPPAEKVEKPVAAAKPAGAFNYNYTYTGPDGLAPTEVYDDGKTTYFKYRVMNQALPNVYLVDAKGRETPVAHYRKGDTMAVDAVTGKMMLKNSSGTVVIFNETLNPL
jgi:type IV secretion system protein VirB9